MYYLYSENKGADQLCGFLMTWLIFADRKINDVDVYNIL